MHSASFKKGAAAFGDKAAHYIETFSDDLRAVAAGMRTLAQQRGSSNREKLSLREAVNKLRFSWRQLVDTAQGITADTPLEKRWSQALVAPVQEAQTREKIFGGLGKSIADAALSE